MTRSRLNKEQLAASRHMHGPALVLAGPGTGKTTTLVARYRYLVGEGVDPAQIFTTTFTRAAARQLKERVRRNVRGLNGAPPIGTFHALCLGLLQGELGQQLDVKRPIKVVSEADRFRILREVTDRSLEVEEVRDAVDRFKDRLMDPAAARRFSRKHAGGNAEALKKLLDAYEGYQRRLDAAGMSDFGDLLMTTVAGLTSRADLRRSWSERFRYLMIDEFQDVNPAQYELIRLLLDQHDNVWAVGDDDQAIYGWRGSDVRYILDFERTFEGTRVFKLAQNYRSRPVILEAATTLIDKNRKRLAKPLRAVAETTGQPRVITCGCSGEDAEADWVADSIVSLSAQHVPLDEIAVLTRVRYLMPTLSSALADRKIPHFVRGGAKVWNSTPARALFAGLAMWSTGGRGGWQFPNYLETDVVAVVRGLRTAAFSAVVDALAALIADNPPFYGDAERETEWKGIVRRVSLETRLFDDAGAFLAYARREAADESSERKEQGVCISTIHQAKGLEWRAVFLVGCRRGIMPHHDVEDLEEERRLAYVASTRAKDYLAVSWPWVDSGPEGPGPSPYLGELTAPLPEPLHEALTWPPGFTVPTYGAQSGPRGKEGSPQATRPRSAGRKSTTQKARPSLASPSRRPLSPPPFAVGDRVRHFLHGRGVVKELRAETCFVRFLQDGYTREIPYKLLKPTT